MDLLKEEFYECILVFTIYCRFKFVWYETKQVNKIYV